MVKKSCYDSLKVLGAKGSNLALVHDSYWFFSEAVMMIRREI